MPPHPTALTNLMTLNFWQRYLTKKGKSNNATQNQDMKTLIMVIIIKKKINGKRNGNEDEIVNEMKRSVDKCL